MREIIHQRNPHEPSFIVSALPLLGDSRIFFHSYNEYSIKVQENILTDKSQPKHINPENTQTARGEEG